MDKFCTNCGKELNLESDYCLNCGKLITKKRQIVKSKKGKINYEVFGIIGLISGVVAFYLSFVFALFTNNVLFEINDILRDIDENLILYKSLFACFYAFLPLIPSVIGVVMSYISVKKEKNIYGIIGLVSGLVSSVFCIGMLLFLIK